MSKKLLSAKSEPTPYRFTVKEWHKLGDAGLFDEGDRVELLNGEIIIMSPIGSRHSACLAYLIDMFAEQNRRRYFVAPGNPIEADNFSEPLPDFCLVPRETKFSKRHPKSKDAFLVVEIADSSLAHDSGAKLRKYAKSGVREYWIVNLRDDVIEVCRSAKGEEYGDRRVFKRGEKVSPLAFADVVIAVSDVIPER